MCWCLSHSGISLTKSDSAYVSAPINLIAGQQFNEPLCNRSIRNTGKVSLIIPPSPFVHPTTVPIRGYPFCELITHGHFPGGQN